MSVRMLKKLQGGADQLELPNDDELDDHLTDNDELDTARDRKSHLNPFDLLNQQSQSESEFKEDDNETEHASAATNLPNATGTKKKKKKRKKKARSSGNHISSEDNERHDKCIVKVAPLVINDYEATPQGSQKNVAKKLLSVELKHLNAQNELRRTFGKRVVKVENKRGRQKTTLKSTHLVTARDSWPPLTKNIITMRPFPAPALPSSHRKVPDVSDSEQWFTFEHSQYYQGVQQMFLNALERTDSDFLIKLIKRCPYHVDSLLQLSDLCKMTEEFSLASELIERALLLLESSLHVSFSLTSGCSRLDYRRQENRPFFIVLFKHAQYLEERACCRTAFEIAKLILSLEPELDPLAIILVIDYYALRSKQFEWVVELYENYDPQRNLSQLPNMAYSYALALFTIHGSCERSNKELQYALLMFPGVLRPLLDEMSVQTDKRVLSSSYFHPGVSDNMSPALHQLVCLYVCRAKTVWRENNVLLWLETNVNAVLDRIDNKDPIVKDYNEKRAARYGVPPRPVLRHIVLSDYKDKVPLAMFLAKEVSGILTYDPLPPLDAINCYQPKPSTSANPTASLGNSVSMFFQSIMPNFNLNNLPVAQRQQQADAPVENGQGRDRIEIEALRRARAANAELDEAAGFDPQPGGEANVSQNELAHSLTGIMDAMREMLHNFRIADHMPSPETAAAQSTTNEEDDEEEEESSDYHD